MAAEGEDERTRFGLGEALGDWPRVRPEPGKDDPLVASAELVEGAEGPAAALALLREESTVPTGTGLPLLRSSRNRQRPLNKRFGRE